MKNIFDILNNAERSSQVALDTQGRFQYPTLGVVTNNNDPLNKRRIRVVFPSCPGLESDWLRRTTVNPNHDDPLPLLGQTVIVLFVDGIETNGFYLQIINDTNPARDKESPVKDLSIGIDGDRDINLAGGDTLEVGKDLGYEVGEDILIKAGKSITFQTTSGASLTLSETGFVVLADAYGHKWTLGGSGGTDWVWDAAGATINIINAVDFRVNSKTIASLGAVDTHGDILTTRGW